MGGGGKIKQEYNPSGTSFIFPLLSEARISLSPFFQLVLIMNRIYTPQLIKQHTRFLRPRSTLWTLGGDRRIKRLFPYGFDSDRNEYHVMCTTAKRNFHFIFIAIYKFLQHPHTFIEFTSPSYHLHHISLGLAKLGQLPFGKGKRRSFFGHGRLWFGSTDTALGLEQAQERSTGNGMGRIRDTISSLRIGG
jgi:hypothetical protein